MTTGHNPLPLFQRWERIASDVSEIDISLAILLERGHETSWIDLDALTRERFPSRPCRTSTECCSIPSYPGFTERLLSPLAVSLNKSRAEIVRISEEVRKKRESESKMKPSIQSPTTLSYPDCVVANPISNTEIASAASCHQVVNTIVLAQATKGSLNASR